MSTCVLKPVPKSNKRNVGITADCAGTDLPATQDFGNVQYEAPSETPLTVPPPETIYSIIGTTPCGGTIRRITTRTYPCTTDLLVGGACLVNTVVGNAGYYGNPTAASGVSTASAEDAVISALNSVFAQNEPTLPTSGKGYEFQNVVTTPYDGTGFVEEPPIGTDCWRGDIYLQNPQTITNTLGAYYYTNTGIVPGDTYPTVPANVSTSTLVGYIYAKGNTLRTPVYYEYTETYSVTTTPNGYKSTRTNVTYTPSGASAYIRAGDNPIIGPTNQVVYGDTLGDITAAETAAAWGAVPGSFAFYGSAFPYMTGASGTGSPSGMPSAKQHQYTGTLTAVDHYPTFPDSGVQLTVSAFYTSNRDWVRTVVTIYRLITTITKRYVLGAQVATSDTPTTYLPCGAAGDLAGDGVLYTIAALTAGGVTSSVFPYPTFPWPANPSSEWFDVVSGEAYTGDVVLQTDPAKASAMYIEDVNLAVPVVVGGTGILYSLYLHEVWTYDIV